MNDITRIEYIGVSSDEDAKASGDTHKVKVTFIFRGYTIEDMADRLMVSSSPKVAVQSVLRKMKTIPAEYTYLVPKAGTRAEVDPIAAIGRMDTDAQDAVIEKLLALRAARRNA